MIKLPLGPLRISVDLFQDQTDPTLWRTRIAWTWRRGIIHFWLLIAALIVAGSPAKATVSCSVPFNLTNGTVADATQVMANFNAILSCLSTSAASSGSNADITALSGLTTPITPAQGGAIASQPQGRLSLTAAPVMTGAITNTAVINYLCYRGGQNVYVFNGTRDVLLSIPGCSLSMTQQSSGTGVLNSGHVFDIWGVNSSGVLATCVATNNAGLGWSGDSGGSDTAGRGTGYTQLSQGRPYLTNANTINFCYNGAINLGPISANQATYLGSEYTTAAGATSMQLTASASGGGANVLGLYNAYNSEAVFAQNFDTQNGYLYGTPTWRTPNGVTGDTITYVDGLANQTVKVHFQELCNTGALGGCLFGVARDWSSGPPPYIGTLFGPQITGTCTSNASPCAVQETSATVPVDGDFAPLAGVHTFSAIEANNNSISASANSYYGNNFVTNPASSSQIITLTAYLRM
jgi:hypothetical protein